MMKRYAMAVAVLTCCTILALASGCRAFNSSYGSSDADLMSKPKAPADAGAAGSASPKPPATAPTVDYSKDKTECKTPAGVTVGKNSGSLISTAGWAFADGAYDVAVTATKLGPNSAAITVAKTQASCKGSEPCPLIALQPLTLTFTVKQTGDSKFSACNFSYSDGKDRVYAAVSGQLMLDKVNAVDAKEGTVSNSGSFELSFTRGDATAAKAQAVYLGAVPASDMAGMLLEGTYFVDKITEADSK